MERSGTGIEQHYSPTPISEVKKMSSGSEAPMFDGCQKVVKNLANNRPMFEGVDTASLQDMAFFAQNEIQERDKSWPPKERVDLHGFFKELHEMTGV